MLRGQHAFHVLHHENRRRKLLDDPQVLPVKEMSLVCFKFLRVAATHPSATRKRISLTGWPTNEDPILSTGQSLPDPAINFAVIVLAQFGTPGL